LTLLLIVLLVVLIGASAFFSASETALFSLSSMKVKSLQQSSDPRKKLVANLLTSPSDLLVSIIMLNIFINILVQNVVSSIFGDLSTWVLTVGLPLALTLIFGEVIPKSLALAHNETVSYHVAPIVSKAKRYLFPIRKAMIAVTNRVFRVLFFFLRKEKEISLEELRHVLKTSRQTGVLSEEEAEIVRGYLNVHEMSVKELMRPREEVLFFDSEDPLQKLIHLFVDQECSRIPVCKGSLDQIQGIITSRNFFLRQSTIKNTQDLIPLLQKPFFVPETTSSLVLLRKLYDKKESLALVVDEYGSVSGLIALEDLVEVVVGEIADRRDEKKRFTRLGKHTIIASGKLEIAEFEEMFQVFLPSESHMVTLGGWLTEQMGEIPKSGAHYIWGDFLFHVLAADATRVRRIYVRRLKGK